MRGRGLALRSDWRAAADAFARYEGSLPTNLDISFEIACAQRIVGDDRGYRQTFSSFRDQAGEHPTPFAAFTLARTAGLAEQDPDLARKAVDWAELSLTDDPRPWKIHALGLAHYRAGDYDAAIDALQESLETGWSDLQNQLALALVYHDTGDERRAREFLKAARTWRDEKQQQSVDGVVDVQVIDWLGLHALLREAGERIDGETTTATSNSSRR